MSGFESSEKKPEDFVETAEVVTPAVDTPVAVVEENNTSETPTQE